jgi:V8-like Glu-specific endopeptidase
MSAHEPVSNRLIERALAEASPGEGGVWELGEHAALGLETVAGWAGPRKPAAHEAASVGGRLRGIDSLLQPIDSAAAAGVAGSGYRSEVVVGSDDRVRIRETGQFPWRVVCALRIHSTSGEQYVGTGWLAGPRTVITAGHCVYLDAMGGWAERVEISPARNGRDRPFSSIASREFQSVRGWTIDGKREHDYAAIILPADQAVPEAGHFGYAVYDASSLLGAYLNVSGYPADKDDGTQWWSARTSRKVDDTRIWYDVDTAAGQSGAPVWRLDPKSHRRVVVGIHTNGAETGNSATRINPEVFANIERWVALGAER